MGAFWAKQPNGKWCRFSTIVDSVTDYNCEKEDILNCIIERTKERFERDFEHGDYNYPFDEVIERFNTNNNTLEEMIEMCKEMGASEEDIEKLKQRVKQWNEDVEEPEEEFNRQTEKL